MPDHAIDPNVSATLDSDTGTFTVIIECHACQPLTFHVAHLALLQSMLTDLMKQYKLRPVEVDLLSVEDYDDDTVN